MAVLMATIRILRDAFWVIIPIGHIGVNKLEGPREGHKYLAYWASVLNTRSTDTLQSSVTIF